MKPWTRDDTKSWIEALEGRLEDIKFYLDKTSDWCDENEIDDDRTLFMCCFLTCIWVSQLRGESISYLELMEILGIQDYDEVEEKLYELDEEYLELEHEELLEKVINTLGKDWEEDDDD